MPDIVDETAAAAATGTTTPDVADNGAPKKGGRRKKAPAAEGEAAAPKNTGTPRPSRVVGTDKLKIGIGRSLVKRPKYRVLVDAFGLEGKTVDEGLKAAADELAPKLKSAKFVADPTGYLRGYLGELLACKALIAADGSADPADEYTGEPGPEDAPAEGTEPAGEACTMPGAAEGTE